MQKTITCCDGCQRSDEPGADSCGPCVVIMLPFVPPGGVRLDVCGRCLQRPIGSLIEIVYEKAGREPTGGGHTRAALECPRCGKLKALGSEFCERHRDGREGDD